MVLVVVVVVVVAAMVVVNVTELPSGHGSSSKRLRSIILLNSKLLLGD